MNLTAGYICGPGKIEKMPAIREELRPAMGVFVACSIQLGCGLPARLLSRLTRKRFANGDGAKTIKPSRFQVPPRPSGAGQSTWTGPPERPMVLS